MIKHCFGSAFFIGGIMISRTKWTVVGKAAKIRQRKKGLWLTVECKLSNGCSTQHTTIDCWLPAFLNDRRRNYFKRFNATGVLVFEGKDTYFLTETLL